MCKKKKQNSGFILLHFLTEWDKNTQKKSPGKIENRPRGTETQLQQGKS